jgi:hypothetical protein
MKKKYSYTKNDTNIYPFKTTDIKTTNINILLNRVRQTKRHDVKKKILWSISLVVLVASVYLIFF